MELTIVERTELEELETVISRNAGVFYAVGCALARIRDARLYRETHPTFEAYCKDRWDMKRDYAYKLIGSSEVVQNLDVYHGIQKPSSERQIRPLTKLQTPELQQEAWQKVIETAPKGKVTAYHVSKVVSEIKKETTEKEVKKQIARAKIVVKEEIVDEIFRNAFDIFYYEVKRARLDRWKDTSKEAALRLVRLIQDLIEVRQKGESHD